VQGCLSVARTNSQRGFHVTVATLLDRKGLPIQALHLAAAPLAKARSCTPQFSKLPFTLPTLPTANEPAGEALLDSIQLLAERAAASIGQEIWEEAINHLEELVAAFSALKNPVWQAVSSLSLACLCTALPSRRRDAFRAAAAAVKAARKAGSPELNVQVRCFIGMVSLSFHDPDEAVRALGEADSTQGSPYANLLKASATLATGDAEAAVEAASTLVKDSSEPLAKAAANSLLSDAQLLLGKPESALSAAEQAVESAKSAGDSAIIAAALCQLGSVATAEPKCLKACEEALKSYSSLGDKSGEAAAHLARSIALLSQQDPSKVQQAIDGARSTQSYFEGVGDATGEAASLAVFAAASMSAGQAQDASQACRQSLAKFKELGLEAGVSFATAILNQLKAFLANPNVARCDFDPATGVAMVEVSDGTSGESLRRVVDELHSCDGLACIVLHLIGAIDPMAAQVAAKDLGIFLVGLRTLALPVVVSISGRIAGPMWGLVLSCDYRIAATSSSFLCPIWGKPECMRSFIGHNATVQLGMSTGPKDALVMLETGVVHQLRRNADDAKKAALEMAKRVASTDSMACRKQPFIMNYAVEEYAMAAIESKLVC